jgi:hypothetical protein
MLRKFLESIGQRTVRPRTAKPKGAEPQVATLPLRLTPIPVPRAAPLSGKERRRWSTNQLSS